MIILKLFMVQPPSDEKLIRRNGYITLLSVLIISSVGLAITVSLILLGLGSSKSSFTIERSAQAKALAGACVEQALQEIRDSVAFSGTGNLTLSHGNCTFTVTSAGGENRSIISSGQVGTVIRKARITLSQINPQINVSSWQELADF